MKIRPHPPHHAPRASILILFCLVAGAAVADTAPPALDDFVRRLESSYREVKALRAEFTQTHKWGSRTRIESGTAYFARGGLMRWDYREPSKKLFLATGKDLILYVPAENQVTRAKVKSSEDVRVPFRLLLSRLNLRRVFERIEFADGALEVQPGSRTLRAFPKNAEEVGYREVLMEITSDFDIRRLVIHYMDRSRMEFLFEGIQRNAAMNPALFRFTPPPGAQIIDQR
jgi:outer membrane lipoprotein carrier protein